MRVDAAILEPVVGRALAAPGTRLERWSAVQVFAGDGQELGVYRVTGQARVGRDPRPWSAPSLPGARLPPTRG
jgi:hypothetical protein